MKKKSIFVILLIILLAILFYVFIFNKGINFNYELFKNNKKEWLDKNINNYSYNYSFMCGVGWGNYDVVVKDKKIISVTDTKNDGASLQLNNEDYLIDNVFKDIEELYLNNKNQMKFEPGGGCYLKSIEVEYNNEYHYPTNYSTNNKCTPGIMDGGGCSYTISDFKIID